VGPAKTDRLIPELGFDLEWPLRGSKSDRVAERISGVGKIGIVSSIADHSNIFVRVLFVEA
jgi:hypothetical protein